MSVDKHTDDRLVQQINQQLDDSVDSLDAGTLSRLNQARHRAIDEKLSGAAARHRSGWLFTGALATVFLVASVVYLSNITMHSPLDNEAFASSDDLELIDDLEFVSWLAAQDEAS